MLDWFRDNKDAVVAIAALSSPIVAMFGTLLAALLSFRAVTTAPRVQREIAQETARMTQEIARNTIRMTQAQITAGLYGAADHQWIVDFRQAIAEVMTLGVERQGDTVMGITPNPEGASTFARRLATAVMQIRLMSWDDAAGTELQNRITDYISQATKAGASAEVLGARANEVMTKAAEVIRRREAKLATYASTASA
jgi:hypothetical protein